MQNTKTLLILALLPLFINAQFIERYNDYKIEWSDVSRFSGHVKGFFDIERNNFSVLVDRMPLNYLGSRSSQIKIKSFQNYQLLNEGKVSLRGANKKVNLLGVIDVGDKAIAFTSRRNIWKRNHANFHHVFNHYNIGETIEGKEILKYIYPYGFNFKGQIDFTSSENFKFGAIYFTVPVRSDDYISMGYIIFNDQTEKIEQQLHLLPYKQYEVTIANQYLTDFGDYFLVAKHYFRRDPLRNWTANNRSSDQMKILHATKDGFEELQLKEEDFIIKSISLDTDQEGNLVGSGFYSDIIGGNVRGIFLLKYDVDQKQVLLLKKNPLSLEMISQEGVVFDRNTLFSNRIRFGRNLNDFNEFNINFFEQTQDGSYIVVAEHVEVEFKNTENTNAETPTSRYDEYFFHNDLLVFKMNSDGKIEWIERIPKYQQSKNDGGYFLSSVEYLTQNKIHIFFNDHKKNYNEDRSFNGIGRLSPTTLTKRNNVIAGVSIDLKSGEVTRKSINGRGTYKTVLVPRISRENNKDKTLLIYGNHGRKHRFGKIEFFN